jgi:hypothetical protein
VKILDMARTLIRLAGLVPDQEIPIVFVGLRPGEKLFEELVGENETREPSDIDSVFRVRARQRTDVTQLAADIARLEETAAHGHSARTLADIATIVPEFGPHVPAPIREHVASTIEREAEGAVLFMQGAGKCPACRSFSLQRSHARSVVERIRRSVSAERLHRCAECGWRGWLTPLDYASSIEDGTAHVPDFSALDAAVGNRTSRGRAFSPRNLQ